MPKLTIDGHEVEVAPGTNLIEAARQVKVDVPYYCYHPALSIAANCRICQVELHEDDKPPRVVVGCQTQCAEGMNVNTVGEDCKKARAATLEFLLANHPLDCPICDKAGECDLQNFSYRHGNAAGRFTEKKRPALKRTSIGNHILLDHERCILCTRCVRFMDEYAQQPQLVVTGRGDRNVISIFPGQKIDSNYEGNLADICPVGALTLQEFHHVSRVWDLKSKDGVCTLCDRGCSIRLETKRNRLIRVRPRENPDVNGHFICDVGRFGLLAAANPEHRVLGLRAAQGSLNADRLREDVFTPLHAHAGRTVVVLSPRLLCEELLLARTVLGSVGELCYVPVPEEGGDDILFTGRRSANEAGLRALGIPAKPEDELRGLLAKADAAVFFDAALAERVQARAAVRTLLILDAVDDATLGENTATLPADADWFIPTLLTTEKSGTLMNTDHILQRTRAALRPPVGAFAETAVLQQMAEVFAVDLNLAGPDLTADLCRALGLEARTLNQIAAHGCAASGQEVGSS